MKVFYVTHLSWKWLSPNQRKMEQNMKNYINIYFLFYVALVLLIDLHFILNKVCCRTIIYMKVYLYNVTHLAWKWLSPNQRKLEQNMKNYINIYFLFYAALMLIIVIYFILNNICCKNENKSPNRNPSTNPSSPY